MSPLLRTIAESLDRLHAKERLLAEHMLRHPEEVVRSGITELAERAGVSTATVSRFCRAFHFAGFADLKVKLSSELAVQAGDGREDERTYQDIVAGQPVGEIVGSLERQAILAISDTTRLLDLREVERALSILETARQIDLYGVATSGVIAVDFQQKLLRLGRRVQAYSDPHLQVTSASVLTKEDAVIAISYSGETPEILDAASCAKGCGATIIGLTNFGPSPLSRLADIRLFTSSIEAGIRRGDMASRLAQLHVLDILFTGLVSRRFKEYVPKLEASYQMVQTYRKSTRS